MQCRGEKFGISDKRGCKRTTVGPCLSKSSFKGPAICQGCQAIYHNKRWHLAPDEAKTIQNDRKTQWVTCKACLKITSHYPGAIISIWIGSLWRHIAEVLIIFSNEVERVMDQVPILLIMQLEKTGKNLAIETIEQKRGERLGRTLNLAQNRDLQVAWSSSPCFCRVNWERWL